MDKTFFVVDLSRLKAEEDTLVNALVLYHPKEDIKMVSTSACTYNSLITRVD